MNPYLTARGALGHCPGKEQLRRVSGQDKRSASERVSERVPVVPVVPVVKSPLDKWRRRAVVEESADLQRVYLCSTAGHCHFLVLFLARTFLQDRVCVSVAAEACNHCLDYCFASCYLLFP